MQRRDQRHAPADPRHRHGQGLIVVHDVKACALALEKGFKTQRETRHLRERACIVRDPFIAVGGVEQRAPAQRQHGVGLAEQVH